MTARTTTRIGELLRVVHDETGATWCELGALCGYRSAYLCDVAAGRRRASPRAARRYAEVFGGDPEEWIGLALLDALDASR